MGVKQETLKVLVVSKQEVRGYLFYLQVQAQSTAAGNRTRHQEEVHPFKIKTHEVQYCTANVHQKELVNVQ